jgi:peptidoglycan/LPS O-acetylase OafA/YrhL
VTEPAQAPVAPRLPSVAGSFSSRANSIGFFRWLLAFSVIFSHAGPLAGFYGQEDLGVQISDEQSLGGVAVAGFFFFSGFLITRSRARTGMVRYFWRRCLRIMPAFWCALLLTAFVLAPIAWVQEQGEAGGYWDATSDSPFTYVWQNMFLVLHQRNIAGMGTSLPFADIGGYDWNGSAWTLQYEFKAYILVGLLGIVGYAASRWLSTAAAVGIMAFNALLWSGHISPGTWDTPLNAPFGHALLNDAFNPMLIAPFAFGMLFAIWGKYIPVHWAPAFVGLGIALVTYDLGGWNVGGQYGLLYFLMWAAIRWTKLQHWEKYGDFSYGVYIFAWPLMQFSSYFGLEKAGMLVYFAVIVVATHAIAFCSWHLIEKPAMSLKDWSPAPLLARLLARLRRRRGEAAPDLRPDAVPDEPQVPVLAGASTDS